MKTKRNREVSLIVGFLVATLLSQNLVIPVMSSSFNDQKNYYSPDPHARSPPGGSHHTPSHHTPSHGTPPSHGSGGGGCGSSPPSCGGSYIPPPTPPSGGNCGTPPYTPTPRPSTPRSPSTPRPSTPRSPPNDPSRTPPTPSGGYYRPPTPLVASPPPTTPSPVVSSPPSTPSPVVSSPPSTPSPVVSSPPYTPSPIVSSPPYTPSPIVSSPPPIDPGTPSAPPIDPGTPSAPPIDPGTPSIPGIMPGTPFVPTPPFLPDPSSNPFSGTCNYWSTHPGLIWGLFGWWATLGSALGTHTLPGLGAGLSLQQALSNKQNDGIGSLYREGTASLLNSMVNNKFPFSTDQVRERFISALSSNQAAASQAKQFKMANEGRLKPRA